jgi:hypothetical protein
MKTTTTFCAIALLAAFFAVSAAAEARGYMPHRTTVQRLADTAEIVIVGRLDRVENTAITEPGRDAAAHKRLNDGTWQDGEDYIRREGVIMVNSVLKGDATAGTELRFVSIRQLKFAAYDADLRTEEAIYFLSPRADGLNIVLSDERGTVTAGEVNGNLNGAISFISQHIASGSTNEAGIARTVEAITLDGSRLSVDATYEFSWHHEEYAPAMIDDVRKRLLALCKLSQSGSVERAQLLTAVGRHPAADALEGLLEVMLGDADWSTTSLASMSLEYVNRTQAIVRLLQEYDLAQNDATRMIIVRSLGLIRPKLDYDGPELRNPTLQIVGSLLVAETDKDLLREALIASRDLRSGTAHVAALKALIDNRETNGLTGVEINAAIIALAAARTAEGIVIEKQYLEALGAADPVLKQIVDSAMIFPYTCLIVGADGKGH